MLSLQQARLLLSKFNRNWRVTVDPDGFTHPKLSSAVKETDTHYKYSLCTLYKFEIYCRLSMFLCSIKTEPAIEGHLTAIEKIFEKADRLRRFEDLGIDSSELIKKLDLKTSKTVFDEVKFIYSTFGKYAYDCRISFEPSIDTDKDLDRFLMLFKFKVCDSNVLTTVKELQKKLDNKTQEISKLNEQVTDLMKTIKDQTDIINRHEITIQNLSRKPSHEHSSRKRSRSPVHSSRKRSRSPVRYERHDHKRHRY